MVGHGSRWLAGKQAMTEYESAALHRVATDESTDIEPRDARALTECQSVLPEADGLYTVVGENGETYTVDTRLDVCECLDFQYREPSGGCKHLRRVAFARGEKPVPPWIDPDAVDGHLGEHVDGSPRVVVTDGSGELLDGETDADHDDGRPDDCDCGEWNDGLELPCWPCYRDGYETPAETDD